MHSTLLIGPYDWDPERFPETEFRERIAALWEQIGKENYAAAVVYGDSRNHAELCYFSHFVPKLGPAFMYVQSEGEPRLLVSGAPNMLPAAQRLTWIERVEPVRDAGKTVLQWLNDARAASPRRIALIGADSMRAALYGPFSRSLDPAAPVDVTLTVRGLMRRKRPRELASIRQACAALARAEEALAAALLSGKGVTAAIIEAERSAYQDGVQDVRALFSLDGGRTLRPFEAPIDKAVDPLHAYFAVRCSGYWAEGFVRAARLPQPAWVRANEGLQAMLRIAAAGTPCRELVSLAEGTVQPYFPHPMTAGHAGNSIGLFLEEPPVLSANGDETLEAGSVYSLRAGASDGGAQHAIASAVILIRPGGHEVLWRTAE